MIYQCILLEVPLKDKGLKMALNAELGQFGQNMSMEESHGCWHLEESR